MERRLQVRLDELLDDAEVHPSLLRGVLPRLVAEAYPVCMRRLDPRRADIHRIAND